MNLFGNRFQSSSSSSANPAGPRYHGLQNQGATCYLNSVLQVLFMTRDFREAVKSSGSEGHIDRLLSATFEELEKETAQTIQITETLGIDRVYEQQDAAEYFQRILQLTSPEASQIFRGTMSHRTSCHQCPKEADVDGPFWYLPLALMDSSSDVYSVEDGIEQFFRASEFRGDNQMYCDGCDDKVDAATKYVLKHHPEVLVLLLKRFDFSYRLMSYVKVNCAVSVPLTLQVPEGQTYELYAVVDHAGDLRSGHYKAKIKSEDDGRWYWFDDTSVTVCDMQPFQLGTTELSKMAYLLFYRKNKSTTQDHDTMEVCANEAPVTHHDDKYQSQDAESGGEREESQTEGSITSIGSQLSLIRCHDEVRERGSVGHQDSEDPEDANDSIRQERDTDQKEDEQRKDDEDNKEGQNRTGQGKPDRESKDQTKPKEDQSLEEDEDKKEQVISATETEHEDVSMQNQVRDQENVGDTEQSQGRTTESPTVGADQEAEQGNQAKDEKGKRHSKQSGASDESSTKTTETKTLQEASRPSAERGAESNEGNFDESDRTSRIATNTQQKRKTLHSHAKPTEEGSVVELETSHAIKKKQKRIKLCVCWRRKRVKKQKKSVGCFPNIFKWRKLSKREKKEKLESVL